MTDNDFNITSIKDIIPIDRDDGKRKPEDCGQCVYHAACQANEMSCFYE